MHNHRTLISIPRPGAADLHLPAVRSWKRAIGAVVGRAWAAYLAGWTELVRSGYAPPGTAALPAGRQAEPPVRDGAP